MGNDIEAARACLAVTERKSIQHIVAQELPRFTQVSKPSDEPTIGKEEAARLLDVSVSDVEKAKHIQDSGNKEIIRAVEDGKMTLDQAIKKLATPPAAKKRGRVPETKRGRNDPAPSRLAAGPARHQAHGYRA